MSKPQRKIDAALVWDGDCAFCARTAAWAGRRFRVQPRIAPWQSLDLDNFGLTARQCHDALQWVDYRGTEAGARAVGRFLQAQGGAWRVIAWVPFLWPFSELAAWTYRLVARNRHRLPGGTAACYVPEETAANDADDASEDPPQLSPE